MPLGCCLESSKLPTRLSDKRLKPGLKSLRVMKFVAARVLHIGLGCFFRPLWKNKVRILVVSTIHCMESGQNPGFVVAALDAWRNVLEGVDAETF